MKKLKRITALIGTVLLLGLYVITFISSITASPHSHGLFLASLYSSIVIPIFIYGMMLVYKLTKKKDEISLDMKESHPSITDIANKKL